MNLSDPISVAPHIGPSYEAKLEKLNIYTVQDLIYHSPRRYLDFRNTTHISQAAVGNVVTLQGEITSAINQYAKSGRQMQIVTLYDGTGKIQIIWFNQKYLLSTLHEGIKVAVAGEVQWFGRQKALISPEYELLKEDDDPSEAENYLHSSSISQSRFSTKGEKSVHTGRLVPLYPETKGISSKWLRARIADVFPIISEELSDHIPSNDREELGLLSLQQSLSTIHFPRESAEVKDAIRRLAFDEFLKFQVVGLLKKESRKEEKQAYEIALSEDEVQIFIDKLPFELTPSQKRSIDEIREDLAKPYPMNRLLEGDVGSGKTVIAAMVCYACFRHKLQCVVMAPTQLLVSQHYQTLSELLSPLGMVVAKVTATSPLKEKNPDVIVGTHSLLFDKLKLTNVGAIVIDEQHRFGVNQREQLVKKSKQERVPDVLTMTATPIPRTIALTAYGDLDLSTLDELPKNRKPITTWIVPNEKRDGAYDWIRKEIEDKHVQVFVVCPLIEESESELLQEVRSVTEEFKRIKKVFSDKSIGLLHGKLKPHEKEEVISQFAEGKIDILVSTPVIEVGIDVPNATIMLIEAADRFGLAQLHQLRGRVGRGTQKSYCLLFTENSSEKAQNRLSAIKEAKTGFELAELDLSLRGPGEIFGTKQSGFPDLHFADWTDKELIELAGRYAKKIVKNSDTYHELLRYLEQK